MFAPSSQNETPLPSDKNAKFDSNVGGETKQNAGRIGFFSLCRNFHYVQ